MQIWVNKEDKNFGPYSLEDLKSYVEGGSINRNDLACEVGSSEWKAVGSFIPFEKALPPPTATLPPPPKQTRTNTTFGSQPAVKIVPSGMANQEKNIWSGRPSQIANLGTFILCGIFCWLIFPIFIALKSWLNIKTQKYEVTNQRIRTTIGIFSKKTDELELYRVKDTTLLRPFFLGLFGFATIQITTSDRSTPYVYLYAIKGADVLREELRMFVEELREAKGVRELDF